MCFFTRIAYWFSNILYVVEKLISYCAFASVVTCIVATMIITLLLGIGLGYNYCFIDITTEEKKNNTKPWSFSTPKSTTEFEIKNTTEPTKETPAGLKLILRRLVTTTKKVERSPRKISFKIHNFSKIPRKVTLNRKVLETTAALHTQELGRTLEIVKDTTQQVEKRPEAVDGDIQELKKAPKLVTDSIQKLGIDMKAIVTTQGLETNSKRIAKRTQELVSDRETVEDKILDSLAYKVVDTTKVLETVVDMTQEVETIADTSHELKTTFGLELPTNISHSSSRRSWTIIVPMRDTNFTSLISRLKKLQYNVTLEMLA